MSAAASPSDPPVLQRAAGQLRLSVKRSPAGTVLQALRQSGCLKLRFPRPVTPGWLDAVTLNTGGGVAGGDRLDIAIVLAPGTRATVTAQAAERFYRRIDGDGPSTVRTAITVAEEAETEYLPQESILFDGSAVDRRLHVCLAPAARFLGLEALVFGRHAMGETLRHAWLRDLIRIDRAGQPLLHDAIRLDGPVHALLQHRAIAGGGLAVATIIRVAPDAEARLDAMRTGLLLTRVVAPDGAALRRTIIAALAVLRDSRPLPRVWMC
jgi:urease accessory protein